MRAQRGDALEQRGVGPPVLGRVRDPRVAGPAGDDVQRAERCDTDRGDRAQFAGRAEERVDAGERRHGVGGREAADAQESRRVFGRRDAADDLGAAEFDGRDERGTGADATGSASQTVLGVDAVAPLQEGLQHGEVVVGSVHCGDEQPEAEGVQLVQAAVEEGPRTPDREPGRQLDLGGVATLVRTPLVQHADLAGQLLEAGERVPDVGVLGHETQGLPLALTADEDRDRPVGAGSRTLPARTDARDVGGQRVGAATRPVPNS